VHRSIYCNGVPACLDVFIRSFKLINDDGDDDVTVSSIAKCFVVFV